MTILLNHIYLFWQTAPTFGMLDVLWMLVQTILALGFVCALAILLFRYVLPKLNVVTFTKSIVRVVDGTPLDARKRLVVVEAAGKYLLLALSENNVQLISELDGKEVERAVAQLEETNEKSHPPLKTVSDSFTRIMDNVRQKRK